MRKEASVSCVEGMDRPCDTHAFEKPTMVVGQGMNVHGNVSEECQDRTYGPWIVVECRRNVQRYQRSGGSHTVINNGKLRQKQRKAESEARFQFAAGKQIIKDGPSREAKRKVSSSKQINQAQIASSISSIRPSGLQQAHKPPTHSSEMHKWTDGSI
nr:hypothetical protein CFP56_47856 [Quercus suber]